jgi:hypothetical protein
MYVNCFGKLSFDAKLVFHSWFHTEKRAEKYHGFEGRFDTEFESYDDCFDNMMAVKNALGDAKRKTLWQQISKRDGAFETLRRRVDELRVTGNKSQRGNAVKVDELIGRTLYLDAVPLSSWTKRYNRLLVGLGKKRFARYVKNLGVEDLVNNLRRENDRVAMMQRIVDNQESLACCGSFVVACKSLDASFLKIKRKLNGLKMVSGLWCKALLLEINRKIGGLPGGIDGGGD